MDSHCHVFRSSILHFPEETSSPEQNFNFFKDGFLVTRNGKIAAIGHFSDLPEEFKSYSVVDYSGKLLVPGFIDCHLHFPQTEMIASYGEQLLQWLQNFTFPTETKFQDHDYAKAMANLFLAQLFSNGTTSAMVYSSVHKQATDALFAAATEQQMALIAGKVCMDRNCPDDLRDCPTSAQKDSVELIEKWHNKGRTKYALTPRFAPTSSENQLAALGELAQQYKDVFIQTHLSENTHEIAWVKELFPQHQHYLDVYDHHHLVRKGSVFGHCIHLHQDEWDLLAATQATIAFCPSSNLFLGSGLFNLDKAKQSNVNVALATDVGAGTSFNMLRTMGDAYKICQLNHCKLSALSGLYMMTQGTAKALDLDDSIGNLNPGSHADFVVLDPKFSNLSEIRTASLMTDNTINLPSDVLFALSMLADERTTEATYIAGKAVFKQPARSH
ncbi:guanine deaminase [Aliiglaciecola lipolytica]|uniref:Guanine deaminase n=1 Tax=Aliiglaciecola lipolytica E3 TaxID=1127673 RepID=K6X236_9ALTE|nr:guanine deaminase [Aliiglaciecola lipolytica]GAC14724.1 guanine deaminase [Aliiglaciecola lipolytica E3]